MLQSDILDCILDSKNFSVGGGSASALAGGIAASLASMVARLSCDKNFCLSNSEYLKIVEEADYLAEELLKGAEEDAKAYAQIKTAFSLPKDTEEEKIKRKEAIQKGFIAAAEVPKENALLCRRVQELCAELQNKSNPACGSDLGCAILLANSGLQGCLLNVETNVTSIKDGNIVSGLQEEVNKLRLYIKKRFVR